MPLVKVKKKYQITIPEEIRRNLDLEIGDYLELEVQGNIITLKPMAVIERGKREAWEKLQKLLNRVHKKIGDVSEEEVERDVMEAIKAVRAKSHD